jgi:hypothetical protein
MLMRLRSTRLETGTTRFPPLVLSVRRPPALLRRLWKPATTITDTRRLGSWILQLPDPSSARRAARSLSLATDLGLGQPMEHLLRSCVLGLSLADAVAVEEPVMTRSRAESR